MDHQHDDWRQQFQSEDDYDDAAASRDTRFDAKTRARDARKRVRSRGVWASSSSAWEDARKSEDCFG